MKNGMTLRDTDGNILHAHGGYMLRKDEWFYWFGENRSGRVRVSCYRSRDLEHWEFRNHVLTLDSPKGEHYVHADICMEKEAMKKDGSLIFTGCNIERPKVIYNQKTDKYVMWMHYENGASYSEAKCAVAVCDSIDGDYTYLGCFSPIGNMSRDCTLFVDDDGSAYFISAARQNEDTILYRLTEDYLAIEKQVAVLWPGQRREAAALCKKDGIYYMITSGCTGWKPNQSKYAWSESLTEKWSMLQNIGDETTYHSQSAFLLPVQTADGTGVLYVGDRWCAEHYENSTYVILPVQFTSDHGMELEYREEIDLTQYH